MKTIIQVWTHKLYNANNYLGLGDIIRGTIKLHQLSKKLGFKLLVDIQLHPVSAYLKPQIHEYNKLIKDNENNIRFVEMYCSEEYILQQKNDVIFFITNDGWKTIEEPLSEECKKFMKDILTPNLMFQQYFIEKKKIIPYEKYNILHYRLGDETLVENINNIDNINVRINLIDNVNKYKESNDVFISDNIIFKNIIKNNQKSLFMFNILPAHIGYHNDDNLIKDSLFEFFIITQSVKIKTYSVYCWISGFVYWAHLIYDIPIIILQN